MRVLIIGCGYVGLPLGARLARSGHQVFGLRRSASADPELRLRGITPIQADITDPGTLARIEPDFDWVVNLTSSSRGGVEEYRAVYLQGTLNILDWLKPSPPSRLVYTSSTSVYAQNDGSWVTEDSPAEPQSETSQVLRETERALLDGFPATILRASGIYGPERGHLFKQFIRGEAAMRDDGAAYLNMVQVEDLAGAIEQCLLRGGCGEIYNATDDLPVTQREFFEWLSQELGRPMPPPSPPDPNRKRGLTNKRLSNGKLKMQTGYQFKYPTYREGYAAEISRLGLKAD